jgi:L-glutamine-phosphate cytidylyltransferase
MNAIILAAGLGTRLRPLTDDRPKALVEMGGESFFERQLRQLRAAGAELITVVTGYKAEAFDPWRRDPDLRFLHNEHYHDRNNIWSMYLARDRLPASLVLEGDVRLAEGILPSAALSRSCVFTGRREDMRNEWVVHAGESGRVHAIIPSSGAGWILTGVSFWNALDGLEMARLLEESIRLPGWEQLFWDDVYRLNLDRLDLYASRIRPRDWVEIDTLEDKERFEASISRSTAHHHRGAFDNGLKL